MTELSPPITCSHTLRDADDLVVRLKEGDEAAFVEAFHLYKDMVYTLAFKLLGDKAESLDVTQEVFLTLFCKIGGFREESSLKTWLYRIAINQAANKNRWWRRRLRNRTLSLDFGPIENGKCGPVLPNHLPSPAREYLSKEIQKGLQKALDKLPFEQRVAVTLRDVEGLRYEEIGELTATRIGTVKSRIARGRERLRELMKDYLRGSAL